MEGFIRLHRSLMSWEWYRDENTMRLFIHCLLQANIKESNHKGRVIKRGSFVSGRFLLGDELGITTSKIRTSLKKLQDSKEIELTLDVKGTIITVLNYDNYQASTETKAIEKKPSKSIEEREKEFGNSLAPFVEIYGKSMVRRFFDYWSERSPQAKKMRFEKQKAFDIKKRLVTWSQKNYDKDNVNTKADDTLMNHIKKQMKK